MGHKHFHRFKPVLSNMTMRIYDHGFQQPPLQSLCDLPFVFLVPPKQTPFGTVWVGPDVQTAHP
jgi:hypothetical protein